MSLAPSDFLELEKAIVAGPAVAVPDWLAGWLSKERLLYVDGQFVGGEGKFESQNPATESALAQVSLAQRAEVDAAVSAAERAYQDGPWAKMRIEERARIVSQIGDLILKHRAPLALLESLDSGKPIWECYEGDIPRAARNFHFFCEYAKTEVLTVEAGAERHRSFREPVGVCALITPWNLPLYLETWKLAPALLMGNSVVLKPSELTPLTASYLSELIDQTELPKGVFNLVQGFGAGSTGEFLVSHPKVGAISFTGETSTGRAIMRSAAQGPTKVSFELGGKGTSIVFGDADLEAALNALVPAGFRNQGQICLAMSRVLVEDRLYDAFVEGYVKRAKAIPLGNPLAYGTRMGAVVGQEQYEKVKSYLAKAQSPIKVETGGKRPAHSERGFFLEPTVLTGVPVDHAISCEEIFGPVVSIHPFRSEKEAVQVTNGTPYGLSASVWSSNAERVARVSHGIRAGLVWANCWFVRDLTVPFGGQKRSGIGREGGRWSLDFFSEWKSVCEKKGFYELASF